MFFCDNSNQGIDIAGSKNNSYGQYEIRKDLQHETWYAAAIRWNKSKSQIKDSEIMSSCILVRNYILLILQSTTTNDKYFCLLLQVAACDLW